MNARLAARISGTKAQHDALTIQALANYSLALQRNTKLTPEQRLQALRFLATR